MKCSFRIKEKQMRNLFRKAHLYIPLILFVFCIKNLHSATITFPVHGLMVASKAAVPIEMDWDEDCFIKTNPKTYSHMIARVAAMLSCIAYIHVEQKTDDNEMLRSYQLLGFNEKNIYWNYNLDYSNHIDKNNQAAYSFAFKDIQTPSGTKKLVFLIIRGTPLNANEWQSNLNISDSSREEVTIHEGFLSTCELIKQDFYNFLDRNKISKEDSYFLLSGHSRGAALANLLGAVFYDEQVITSEKVFVYTFASPNVTQDSRALEAKYSFIWNIISAEDAVPSVPPYRNNWKWKKFGQTRVMVNYWNTDSDTYMNNYIPRMNTYYKKLLLREYVPLKTGPFYQVQTGRVLTSYYKNVGNYYWQGLHFMSSAALNLAFPDETKQQKAVEKHTEKDSDKQSDNQSDEAKVVSVPLLLKPLNYIINSHVENGLKYIINAAIDMHAGEAYLSWILALNEDELYSSLGSSQIVIGGAFDGAVYDESGRLLARIINGDVEIFSVKAPAGIMPLPYKNVLGFPGNQNLNVILHKDSLIPTYCGYKIEHYDAAGKLLSTSEKEHFSPYSNLSISFKAGKVTLEEDKLAFEKLTRKEAKPLIKKYRLNENFKFMIEPEVSYSFDKIFSLGTRIGFPVFYTTLLGEIHNKNSKGFAAGLGHQHIIYGRVLFDTELFARCIFTPDDKNERKRNLVPQARFSFSYKPLRRAHYFTSLAFDMHIDDYNDEAFLSTARKSRFSSIKVNDKIQLQPSIVIGARY